MSFDFCVDVNELILLNQQNKLLLNPFYHILAEHYFGSFLFLANTTFV
jgi:hypothetical protein